MQLLSKFQPSSHRYWKEILKLTWKHKNPMIAKTLMKHERTAEGTTITVVPPLWTPKEHQGAEFDTLALESLYYKLEFGPTHRTVFWWGSPELSMGQGFIGSGSKWLRVQPGKRLNWATIVSLQVGSEARPYTITVWRYIWNSQTNHWETVARK